MKSGSKALRSFIFSVVILFRSKALLEFFKAMRLMHVRKIEHILNPNIIRKHTKIQPKRNTITCRGKSGETLMVDINDVIGYKYWHSGERDPQITKLCQKFCAFDGAVFLDIGANVGTTSIAPAIKSHCKVICIEASKFHISLLSDNLYSNNINSLIFHCAVTSPEKCRINKELNLFVSPGNTGASSLFASWNTSQVDSIVERVPTSTIDSCLSFSKENIDLIGLAKIDIEGGEYDALLGADLIMGKVPLIVEYIHDSNSSKKLVELLQLHYKLFFLDKECNTYTFNSSVSCGTMLCLPTT